MKKTLAILLGLMGVVIAGCLDTSLEEQKDPDIPQTIDYREQEPNTDQGNGEEQLPEIEDLNDDIINGNNLKATSFGNEDLAALAEIIRSRVETVPGVNGAQTVVTSDRIMIALDVQNYETDTQTASIVRQVAEDLTDREDIQEKEVVVYTDQKYFDRIKNLNARQGASGLFDE